MKLSHLAFVALVIAGPALAQSNPDLIIFDAQIMALHQRIGAESTGGVLKPEMIQDLQGKQQELENREAKLKQSGAALTPDEKSAMALSISEQQKRLVTINQQALPNVKHVDPASLPPPTYMTPNGMTITGPNPALNPNGGSVVTPVPRSSPQ